MRIKKTTLPDGRLVSTAHLVEPELKFLDPMLASIGRLVGSDSPFNGVDHSKPFEVMLFVSEDDYTDLECERYDTRDEALAAHDVMVARHSGMAT